MMRVFSMFRSAARAARGHRLLSALALVALVLGCSDKITGPTTPMKPGGKVGVFADLATTGVTTLVIQVSGAGIVKSDGSADTLAFNIPLTNGVAAGSLDVPAGPARVITAHAFAGLTETHRGSVTTDIMEGNNPTLHITLVPLVGSLPLTVSIGSTIVVVRPLVATIAIGDTVRLTSEIRDNNGQVVNAGVRWATLNPLKATVDSLGLVTVRDTGTVQIVGTYGTVGGSASLTGIRATSVAANFLTWNGTVNTNWSEPNNWTPHGLGAARVPTLSDSVVVPAAAPRMPTLDQCIDNNAVRDIVIEQGASLGTSCYPLNVYGSAVVAGTVPTVYARPNAKLAGHFSSLYIKGGGVTLVDSVSASSVQLDLVSGTFVMNGKVLRTSGDFTVNSGTVTMADADTLVVGGNVWWNGGDQNGLLTGGVVFLRGTQFYGQRYFGTGTSRLVLDRTASGQQTLNGFDFIGSPANSQIRRLEIRNRDGVNICGHVRVADTLSLASTGTPSSLTTCSSYQMRVGGPVITTANTDVANYEMDLRDVSGTSLIAGTWHPDITDFSVDNQLINSALAYKGIRLFAHAALTADLNLSTNLSLQGTGAELDLAGHHVHVGGFFETLTGAMLTMTHPTDSLVIGEQLNMPADLHLAQKAKLTSGVITVGSYLEGTGFASSGTKVVMTGTSASSSKYINSLNYENRATQEFYDLEIAASTTYGICQRVRVAHDLTVRSGAKLQEWCGSSAIMVNNDLVTEAGSTINPNWVLLNSPIGTSHVLGAFSPAETQFLVANTVMKPALAYQTVRIFAQTQLSGPTTTTGPVILNGAAADLTINGQALNVGGYLQLDNSSTLTMNNPADAVTVAAYVNFNSDNSTVHAGKLTAGTLTIGEYLAGQGFSASGTHTVVLASTSPSSSKYITQVNYESRPAQGFQNLEIAPNVTYGLCERVAVKGTLTVHSGAKLQDWCSQPYIRLDGDMVGEATSTINPFNVILNSASGTDNVAGTYGPANTTIANSAAAGHLKVGLGYQTMILNAPVTLAKGLTVSGDLYITGPASVLTLNGNPVTVSGNMFMQSNATIVMQNASDALDVNGNVSWNGGGSESGKLTSGTTTFRGATACLTNYETASNHTTVFNRVGDFVRLQCVSSSSTAQLMNNVHVMGWGVALECNMNVANTLTVDAGATVRQNCGSGTLYVGSNLVTASGSAVTNGPSYPGSNQMSVVLGGSSGTGNVSGAYDAHFSDFTALNATIRPTTLANGMDYKHVAIEQSTAFVDSTEIDGGLTINNNSIVDLGGHTIVVKGTMDFNNAAKLKMVSSNDTLVVGSGDPTADLLWDGGDNSTDGTYPILTAGAVKFYGDRFYGPQYKPQPGSHHRFIFASNASGSVSIENNPQFAQMEVRGLRTLVNNASLIVVNDSLMMGASTAFGGGNQLQLKGDLVTQSGSDLSVGTIYLDNASGTSAVGGRFRPTLALFRSPTTPAVNAIKPGLEYKSVSIESNAYQLVGATALANDLQIVNGGHLTLYHQTLNVGGRMDVGSSGGGLIMTQSTDAVNVAGVMQFNSGQTGTILSAGTMTVGGGFNMFTDVPVSGTHRLVMNNSAPQTINALNGSLRALQNVDIAGTGSVNLSSGIVTNGSFRILTPVAVSGANSSFGGSFETVAGSAFTHSNLTLYDPSGTSLVLGTLNISGTITFASGSQTVQTGANFSYANMTIGSAVTVSGGTLSVPGTLTINSGGSVSVPSGSALGAVNVSGTLSFLGSSTSTNTLTINSGGVTNATADLSSSLFIDFGRISLNSGGLMNTGDRSFGAGGFRYKTTGSPSGFSKNGSVFGPDPVGQP